MNVSERIAELRRREGLSQEQLADRLGVTRQSVSKWESGSATPELSKLIALSDLFGITVDTLVRDDVPLPEQAAADVPPSDLERRLGQLEGAYQDSFGSYLSYTSRARVFGLPLVSIRFGRERHPSKRTTAVGIIAIGNFAVGGISIGLISAGLLSLGVVAFGGLAVGITSIGGVAFGVAAMGGMARGISASGLAAKGIAARNFWA